MNFNIIDFIISHREGFIALGLGLIYPTVHAIYKYVKFNLQKDIAKDISNTIKELDIEVTEVKEKVVLLREKINYLNEKQAYTTANINDDIKMIAKELEQIDNIRSELANTRELMITQYNTLQNDISQLSNYFEKTSNKN